MSESYGTAVPRVRFPLWFRAAVVALFASLWIPYFLVRGGGGAPPAFARSVFERFDRRIAPVLNTQAAMPRTLRGEPTHGAYYMNGMLVQFQMARAPVSAEEVVKKFEAGFKKTGYLTRRILVQGQPTLVGLHPKTAMMLTVRPGRDATGQTIVRLAQQDLSMLRPDFRAEISGIPTYPGAEGTLLVQAAKGPPSQSLTFSLQTLPSTVADYYRREMANLGWEWQAIPLDGAANLTVLQFRKHGAECSILLISDPHAFGTFVMLTKTGDEDA